MVLERTPVSAVGEALEYKVKPQVLDGKERNSGQLHTYATLALTLCPRKLQAEYTTKPDFILSEIVCQDKKSEK